MLLVRFQTAPRCHSVFTLRTKSKHNFLNCNPRLVITTFGFQRTAMSGDSSYHLTSSSSSSSSSSPVSRRRRRRQNKLGSLFRLYSITFYWKQILGFGFLPQQMTTPLANQRRCRAVIAPASSSASSAAASSSLLGSTTSRTHMSTTTALSDASSTSSATTSGTIRMEDLPLTDTMWGDYQTMMKDIMARDRVVKKANSDLLPAVQEYLLDPRFIMQELPAISSPSNENFRDSSRARYESFCELKGWNKEQADYLVRCLSYTADMSAKRQATIPAALAWLKLRETGFVPRENSVSTFLFILGVDPDSPILQTLLSDVANLHDACFAPNEKTVFLRIKSFIAQGNAQAAEDLLHAIPNFQRLRTLTPILSYYCRDGDAPHSLRIFRNMREAPGVHLDAETYVLLLTSLAEQGYFDDGNNKVEADAMMKEAGFAATGPTLFDALASEMAQDLLEFNETHAVALYQTFQSTMASDDTVSQATTNDNVLPKATTMSSLTTSVTMGRVSIDPTTCLCPETGAKLQLLALTSDQRKMVHETLLDMASSQHEEFSVKMQQKGKIRAAKEASSGDYALENLKEFVDWVIQRNFTAIVDGPNVAYYGHPVLHYSQVARMVEYLESMGEKPLVTMPYKYCLHSFYVATIGRDQTLSPRDLQVIADLQAKDQFYMVPEWCLDDYYWMIASVVAHVSVTSDDVTLPGLRPLLITNDQMRDHRLSLLEPRLFRRWTSCHIVRFNFGSYEHREEEWAKDRPIHLEHADSFSREIQSNPTIKGGTAWHIPIAEWSESHPHDRFCFSIGPAKM